MPTRRASELWWPLLAVLLCCSSCQSVSFSFENKTGSQNDSRPRVFSPRMDYDEWTPLGRGDPLKNNPTFDYVPPVLDRVQYWLDTQQQHTTEPSSKRDILVLGVTAKKTSPKIPEQFLKFVDGPKFTRAGSQDASSSYRNDYTGSTGAEPPKIMRTTSFRNGVIDYRNQNRLQSLPASYYPNPYYSQKIKPYTMMMPPPMIQKTETSTSFNIGTKDKVVGYPDIQSFGTQTEEGPLLQDVQYYGAPSKDYGHYSPAPSLRPYSTSKTPPSSKIETIKSVYVPQTTKSRYEATTTPSVSFEKSNLIYQSTQTLSGGWLGNNRPTSSSSTNYPTDVNQVTWQSTDYSRDHYEMDHHAAASSNHEVVVGQNANIVVDASNNGNEEVVVGQKEVSTETTSSTSENVTPISTVTSTSSSTDSGEQEEEIATDTQPAQKMHIVVANSPSSVADLETHKAKKGPVAVVMPTNYMEKNTSAISDPPIMPHSTNTWEDAATSEMTRMSHEAPKPQPQPAKNAITSSPIPMDDRPHVSSMPSKMMAASQPPHQPSHLPSVMPTRHAGGSPHMFMPPQAASQSLIRPQSRPSHVMMHFIGSMRPGFRPSSPMTMSHMSPPMAHMHMPPMKSMIALSPTMEQAHQRPPQPFPVTFTSPPSPSTSSAQNTGPDEQTIDQRPPSRLPATTANSMTTAASFTPTISSTIEYTPIADSTSHQESTKPAQSVLAKLLSTEESTRTRMTTLAPSSTILPRTTTVPSLTTDPIFSHYKQPAKPIRGPMYLIIQGHSKVKTYKPTVNKHGVPVENNEIVETSTKRQLSKLEQLIWENTKGGSVDLAAEKRKLEEKARAEKHASSRYDNLMSLVESGLSGFTVSPSTEDERRASNSVTSIEIN